MLLTLGVLASCGSSSSSDGTGGSSSGGASTGGSSSGGASTGGAAGTASGGAAGSTLGGTGGGGVDAGSDASDGGPFVQDAGMFDCRGCGCDGTTHYCVNIAAGAQGVKPFGTGECQDVTDPGKEGCHPLPSACAGVPACGCLPSPMPGYGACFCDDVGGGLSYNCALP